MFKRKTFDISTLPMGGKRKFNDHQERRGRQTFRRKLSDRQTEYPTFERGFGHLERDTIVGIHHKSAVVTLVERLSKIIITFKPGGRTASAIETMINECFHQIPRNLFKFITLDCDKEFSNWRSMSNQNDIKIYFADPGHLFPTRSERAFQ